jgi:hypothetical protein
VRCPHAKRRYEPARNPPYRDVLTHDGITALSCRASDPNRKARSKMDRRVRARLAATTVVAFDRLELSSQCATLTRSVQGNNVRPLQANAFPDARALLLHAAGESD